MVPESWSWWWSLLTEKAFFIEQIGESHSFECTTGVFKKKKVSSSRTAQNINQIVTVQHLLQKCGLTYFLHQGVPGVWKYYIFHYTHKMKVLQILGFDYYLGVSIWPLCDPPVSVIVFFFPSAKSHLLQWEAVNPAGSVFDLSHWNDLSFRSEIVVKYTSHRISWL